MRSGERAAESFVEELGPDRARGDAYQGDGDERPEGAAWRSGDLGECVALGSQHHRSSDRADGEPGEERDDGHLREAGHVDEEREQWRREVRVVAERREPRAEHGE